MENRCTSLLARLCDVVEAKRSGVEKADLKTLLSQTAVQIVKLRQAAKQQVEDVEQHKSDTAQSRAEVDVSNLQLQNLLYEKNYYTKEIATCKNFRCVLIITWRNERLHPRERVNIKPIDTAQFKVHR